MQTIYHYRDVKIEYNGSTTYFVLNGDEVVGRYSTERRARNAAAKLEDDLGYTYNCHGESEEEIKRMYGIEDVGEYTEYDYSLII